MTHLQNTNESLLSNCDCHSRKFSFKPLSRFLNSPPPTTTTATELYTSIRPGYPARSLKKDTLVSHSALPIILELILPQSKPSSTIFFTKMSAASSSSSVRTLLGSRSQTLASFRCARTKTQRLEGGLRTMRRDHKLITRIQQRICSSCRCRDTPRSLHPT